MICSGRAAGQLAGQSTHQSILCITKFARQRISASFTTSLHCRDDGTSSQASRPNQWEGDEVDKMFRWLNGPGAQFRQATGPANYLGARQADAAENAIIIKKGKDGEESQQEGPRKRRLVQKGRPTNQPFKLNPFFKSQPVLSEELKEAIYLRIMNEEKSVREISEHFGVTMERVAAVVRMKQIERDRLKQGKPLAPFLNKAIMSMLPQTPYSQNAMNHKPHESINDVPVISATTNQVYWITSESRPFTRVDAGEAFKEGLLPADMRIPHPQMVQKLKTELTMSRAARMGQQAEHVLDIPKKSAANNVKVVEGGKWDFKIEDVNVETTGPTGRSRKGVGYRYGMPHEDRKRGQIKIPTHVD